MRRVDHTTAEPAVTPVTVRAAPGYTPAPAPAPASATPDVVTPRGGIGVTPRRGNIRERNGEMMGTVATALSLLGVMTTGVFGAVCAADVWILSHARRFPRGGKDATRQRALLTKALLPLVMGIAAVLVFGLVFVMPLVAPVAEDGLDDYTGEGLSEDEGSAAAPAEQGEATAVHSAVEMQALRDRVQQLEGQLRQLLASRDADTQLQPLPQQLQQQQASLQCLLHSVWCLTLQHALYWLLGWLLR